MSEKDADLIARLRSIAPEDLEALLRFIELDVDRLRRAAQQPGPITSIKPPLATPD